MKVLLVDDDAFLRDMYATKFREAGHTVDAAEDGQIALTTLERDQFDVVLFDMVMPGLDGISFLSKATTLTNGTKTKYIVLSNQGEETDKESAKKAGAAGYIVKAESIPSEVVHKVETLAA